MSKDSGILYTAFLLSHGKTDMIRKYICFYFFVGFLFGVTSHWDCTIVRKSSSFFLIAVAQLRIPQGAVSDVLKNLEGR